MNAFEKDRRGVSSRDMQINMLNEQLSRKDASFFLHVYEAEGCSSDEFKFVYSLIVFYFSVPFIGLLLFTYLLIKSVLLLTASKAITITISLFFIYRAAKHIYREQCSALLDLFTVSCREKS